jgi:hypothetical protein
VGRAFASVRLQIHRIGFGKGGAGILRVDGAEVASNTIPHTILPNMPWDETFDVGVDTRKGVNDGDCKSCSPSPER